MLKTPNEKLSGGGLLSNKCKQDVPSAEVTSFIFYFFATNPSPAHLGHVFRAAVPDDSMQTLPRPRHSGHVVKKAARSPGGSPAPSRAAYVRRRISCLRSLMLMCAGPQQP